MTEAWVLMGLITLFWVLRKTLNTHSPIHSGLIIEKPDVKSVSRFTLAQELKEYFSYYQRLDKQDQKRFVTHVQKFIAAKEFIPRGYTHVSDHMKIMIAASAIQLTFGFRHLNFSHFKRILVYPDDYYSLITRKYHQGEVNQAGIIVLSWQNFKEGYQDEEDGKNLGLHEMAHALRLENAIGNEEFDFIEPSVLEAFEYYAQKEMRLIEEGKSIFRKYGAANIHEFFAVSVEHFFERPQSIFKHNPQLYYAMVKMLKQDTLLLA